MKFKKGKMMNTIHEDHKILIPLLIQELDRIQGEQQQLYTDQDGTFAWTPAVLLDPIPINRAQLLLFLEIELRNAKDRIPNKIFIYTQGDDQILAFEKFTPQDIDDEDIELYELQITETESQIFIGND